MVRFVVREGRDDSLIYSKITLSMIDGTVGFRLAVIQGVKRFENGTGLEEVLVKERMD